MYIATMILAQVYQSFEKVHIYRIKYQSFDRLCVGHVHCVWETDCVVLREIFPAYFPRHVSGLGSRALTPKQVKS